MVDDIDDQNRLKEIDMRRERAIYETVGRHDVIGLPRNENKQVGIYNGRNILRKK